jgi:hypothetical protein
MSTYGFNWSWISAPTDTKNASSVVHQGGGSIFSFRQPSNGVISSSDLTSFSQSVSQNLQQLRSNWKTYIRPILNSLPAGNTDARWSTIIGKGLPSKIDCFVYGVQGSTLFVFNDATSTKADGRYWHSTDLRPKTIAEKFEDLYQTIDNIETASSGDYTVDLDPLWAAIGEDYRDADKASTYGSLDTRVSTIESLLQQLNNDIYDPGEYEYGLGQPLPYSIADYLDALVKIHNISGFGADPSGVDHSDMSVAAHTHSFDEITSAPSVSDTSDRSAAHTTLEDEVKRLRWEINRTRGGSNWYSDISYPWTGIASLAGHIALHGTSTPSTSNPHGINYTDTGAAAVFNAVRAYTGMTSNTDVDPAYDSTYYISQGTSHTANISALDSALHTLTSSAIFRVDYGPYDRSYLSTTDRANAPITINHGYGRKPVINIIDESPEIMGYGGQYSSPTYDAEVDYPDNNTVRIWTEAAIVSVIAFF